MLVCLVVARSLNLPLKYVFSHLQPRTEGVYLYIEHRTENTIRASSALFAFFSLILGLFIDKIRIENVQELNHEVQHYVAVVVGGIDSKWWG